MDKENLKEKIVELIERASTRIPDDVRRAIIKAKEREQNERAKAVLDIILQNCQKAYEYTTPICQDTGSLLFFVEYGPDQDPWDIEDTIKKATVEATQRALLRPNSVDPVTGENTKDNTGNGTPYIHLEPKKQPGLFIRLMLKGGGSENVGTQYSLPDKRLNAGRDLEGVRRCILDAIFKAQGKGCSPGVVGVCIGGDRATSYIESKLQLLRPLDDKNPDPVLAELETRILKEANELGIGPMGFGGNTTLLGVKIGKRNRVPASFFVTVSYMCWAYRKASLSISPEGSFQFI